ncbi:GLABROUS1 enhancer-binding protein-like [Bidens hawaiensis]|uniref:GLABROUS1 enhancer-binding protein-like n=1 Tax=Bidens hawaiensis TaxID=980011 RepID=UPI0040495697
MAGSESEIQPANSSSGDEAGHSSDGSESDPPPPPPPPSDQPDPTPTKPRSKIPIQSTSKRPIITSDIDTFDPTKRVKTHPDTVINNNNNNGGEKKLLFQRLWSEENEVELIQGMIDYVKTKGKDPAADVNDFHEFVKKSLHVDVNDRQMLAKARRLKKKFENNVARVETKGKVRSFSNPHEKKMYELSKHLWGSDGSSGGGNNNIRNVGLSSCSKKVKVKVNVTPKSRKFVVPENGNDVEMKSVQAQVQVQAQAQAQAQAKAVQSGSDGLGVLGSLGLPFTDEVIMRKGLELVSGAKKVEMEEKWKDLKMQELQHFMKKVDVLKEQAEIVFNAIAKSVAK